MFSIPGDVIFIIRSDVSCTSAGLSQLKSPFCYHRSEFEPLNTKIRTKSSDMFEASHWIPELDNCFVFAKILIFFQYIRSCTDLTGLISQFMDFVSCDSCPGLARVCQSLESCVTSNLSLPLTTRLSLSELEAHLTQVDRSISLE